METRDEETRIDLLRHGEPVGGRRYRGQVDDALSESGWEQMWNAVGADPEWQQIVSSPLQRCSAFAASLAESLALPVQLESRFTEVGFGDWEGKTRDELDRLEPGQVARFYQDPVNNRPPGAEPLEEFTARVQAAFNEILERFTGQSVLVVAHAGVIRAILAHTLDIPFTRMYRISVPTAGISRLSTNRERGFNFISHGSS
ncbi:MAG: alpha-ribazole phosphatase family protein [Gammaproteobacteria bacterium]|jgi:alpha-ribazole phosphatase/probable phosphoglycerate mutase|nr:alpha-ribazole phosphatase family protein [Gammaproteobacteria bacterium]